MASQPFTGGAEGLAAEELYQKRLRQDEDQKLQRDYTRARIDKLENPTPRVMGRNADKVPINVNGQQYNVTPNAAVEHYDRQLKKEKTASGKDVISKHGLTVEDLNTPNLIKYYRTVDGKQVQVSNDEAKERPNGVVVDVPGTSNYIPFDQWKAMESSFRKKHGSDIPAPDQTPYAPGKAPTSQSANSPGDYPVGTKARKGDQWFVMTTGGWRPAVP
jgi:hypothetical protein